MPLSLVLRFSVALWKRYRPWIDRAKFPWRIRFGPHSKTVPMGVLVERLSICVQCEHLAGHKCSICGCHLPTKTQWATEACPIENWVALQDKEEAKNVDASI